MHQLTGSSATALCLAVVLTFLPGARPTTRIAWSAAPNSCPRLGADDVPLKRPSTWNAADPLPIEKTNCVRCHLTAGRELTVPVRDFARSVHDLAKLSCNSCHGGNTKEDSTAHEQEHGFI